MTDLDDAAAFSSDEHKATARLLSDEARLALAAKIGVALGEVGLEALAAVFLGPTGPAAVVSLVTFLQKQKA